MDMTFSAEDEAFREEVRTFIAENLPLEIQEAARRSPAYVPKEYTRRWHKILFEKGWVAPSWPKEHGGCEWTPVQKHIYDEEYQNANAPRLSSFGITMIQTPVVGSSAAPSRNVREPSCVDLSVRSKSRTLKCPGIENAHASEPVSPVSAS